MVFLCETFLKTLLGVAGRYQVAIYFGVPSY